MNHVEVISELDSDPPELPYISDFADGILSRIGVENWQMSVVLTDDDGIRNYNRDWRNRDQPTDVLSFVQDEGQDIPAFPGTPKEAGDVIISLQTVSRNAADWKNSYDEELRRVIIHGILHLNGMDHPGDDYDVGMLKLQEELLTATGKLMKDDR